MCLVQDRALGPWTALLYDTYREAADRTSDMSQVSILSHELGKRTAAYWDI
jgi:hypothetical protein